MRPTHTHIHVRLRSRFAAVMVLCVLLTLVRGPSAMVPTASAASTFRPTILVSTEAFLVIDDDDTSADVVMRFGDTLAKTLSFNRSLDRFEFNDDVYVAGTVQATNTVSGANVYAAKSLRSSGSLVWEGAASGSSLIVSNNVGIAVTTAKAKLSVNGIMSGVTLYATQSFSGAGLTSCSDGTTSKLLWNATTGRFSCGTDQTGGSSGGNWSNTGSLQLAFDSRYVNVAGDTMTGALNIQSGNSAAATLANLFNVRGTMSGKSLNVMGTGATALLATDTGNKAVRVGGSGMLLLGTRSDPSTVPANTAGLYAQKIAGKTQIMQSSGSTFAATPLQASLFGNQIMILTPGGGTTVNGQGTTVTNDTTVSHPAAGQVFGYMANFATTTTANDEAGTSSANTAFFRGSTAGANGFFFAARVGVVDATSITVFSGMADQTIATMVGADNPAGNHVGFQFSTGRSDTNWMFTTKDNTTQNVNSTGIAFTANKVYDLYFTCTKQCASIIWEIRNVTDGTSATGTTSSNLPTTSTALRIILGVETETTAARNIRMQQIYVEADR